MRTPFLPCILSCVVYVENGMLLCFFYAGIFVPRTFLFKQNVVWTSFCALNPSFQCLFLALSHVNLCFSANILQLDFIFSKCSGKNLLRMPVNIASGRYWQKSMVQGRGICGMLMENIILMKWAISCESYQKTTHTAIALWYAIIVEHTGNQFNWIEKFERKFLKINEWMFVYPLSKCQCKRSIKF